MKALAAAWMIAAGAAAAQTYASGDEARAAIARSEREAAQIEADYQRAERDCRRGFFVNACIERARAERDHRKREVRQRELAARDAVRRFDAEERERSRKARAEPNVTAGEKADEGSGQARPRGTPAAPPPSRPLPKNADGAASQQAAEQKKLEAEQRRREAEDRATAHAAERERRSAEHAQRAAESAARGERYEERLRAAKAREEEKARSAERSAQRRERRRLERERADEELRKASGK